MMTIRQTFFLLTFSSLSFVACKEGQSSETRNDFKTYYDQFNVEGSFILYDPQHDKYVYYNESQTKQPFIPASTFKICNTLIGLETGVIPDEHFVIPWDSVIRNPVWDKDHDLRTAFKNSTVWYYQEVARRIGGEKMKYWLEKATYGNADTTGGIDHFWLDGGLRITPMEQIDFLTRLYNDKLPFSKRAIEIAKDIMMDSDTLDYKISGKTGWGGQEEKEIGWFVGYLERGSQVYYFSNCVQADTKKMEDVQHAIAFDQSRKQIVYQILKDLTLTGNAKE